MNNSFMINRLEYVKKYFAQQKPIHNHQKTTFKRPQKALLR